MEDTQELIQTLEATREALEDFRVPVRTPGYAEREEMRKELLTSITMRFLPRLRNPERPHVVVFAGSSGVGRSTVVNSLVGEEVSPAGSLRPTTRTPVLIAHPRDVRELAGCDLLSLGTLTVSEAVPRGILLIDAPDFDTREAVNREASHRLLDTADAWVFLTSAKRYGDGIAWEQLSEACRREIPVAAVITRVSEAAEAITRDFTMRLVNHNLPALDVFVVPECALQSGLMPPEHVKPLRTYLEHLAADAALDRLSLSHIRSRLIDLAEAGHIYEQILSDAQEQIRIARAEALARFTERVDEGILAQGEASRVWMSGAREGEPLEVLLYPRKRTPFATWQLRRAATKRQAILGEVKQAVQENISIALAEAIYEFHRTIQQEWRAHIAELPAAALHVEAGDVAAQRAATMQRIDEDILARARPGEQHSEPYLDAGGVAAVMYAALAGVHSATRVLTTVCRMEGNPGRDALLARAGELFDTLAFAYEGALSQMHLPRGEALRLRASEFLAIVGESR